MFTEIPANKKSLAFRKPIYGIGINDSPYMVQTAENGKKITCKYYAVWKSMFVRCYSSKYKEKFNTYSGCKVSKEWHSFMSFREWMKNQDWKGRHLDKDLLVHGNKVYSKEFCIFVPHEVNALLTDSRKARGQFPLGVGFHKSVGKFYAACGIGTKQKHLGYFDSVEDAFAKYKAEKSNYMKSLADKFHCDSKLHDALLLNAQRIESMSIEQGLNIDL